MSAEVPEILFSHDARDEAEGSRRPPRSQSPLPAPPTSLADELAKEDRGRRLQNGNGTAARNGTQTPENGTGTGTDPAKEAMLESGASEEGEWFTEEDSLFEEIMEVDPLVRTEVDMLQKEKEGWEAEQKRLEGEKREIREQKEAFER